MKIQEKYKSIQPVAVATDCVVFGFSNPDNALHVLLIQRENEPYAGNWALPGGFVFPDETTEACATRILYEKTDIQQLYIEQLRTYSEPNRDPRQRIISVAYFALVNCAQFNVVAGRNTLNVRWFALNNLPELAFDHALILRDAQERLKGKIRYQPIGFELLDHRFTLSQLQQLYESILGMAIDKRNFRKKILSTGLLIQTDEKEQNVARRAASYYCFDRAKYSELSVSGFHFEL